VSLAPDKLRIGPFAALGGTTPPTTPADVERVREIVSVRVRRRELDELQRRLVER